MGCFFFHQRRRKDPITKPIEDSLIDGSSSQSSLEHDQNLSPQRDENIAQGFAFHDLAKATHNFHRANLLGEGGFGRVFKGWLESGEVVAIKQLSRDGAQGSKEFLTEVLMLIMLRHPNLVTSHGFCNEGDEKLLVYEFMAEGSLEDHLFDLTPEKRPLDWNTRTKIALGAAKGLQYLHNEVSPPVIYRDMKAANILLDADFNPKVSDFGLARFGPVGVNTHVSTRIMGTYGYCAPEYARTGQLTVRSDIYSFGMLLLELISGQRAYDSSRRGPDKYLHNWAFRRINDRRRFLQLADPALDGCFPVRAFWQMVIITNMCLLDKACNRPSIDDVVSALEHIVAHPYTPKPEVEPANPSDSSGTPSPSSSSSSPHGFSRFRKLPRYSQNRNSIQEN